MGWLRARRWLAITILVAILGFLLLVAGVTAEALRTANEPLGRSANQATILGAALTVAGLACSVGRWAWHRLRGVTVVPVTALELLRAQVSAREQAVSSALLAGLVPVNLAYASAAEAGPASRPERPTWAVGALPDAMRGLLRYTGRSATTGDGVVGAGGTSDLRSVGNYFAELENGRLVVLGRPGSGKTVLAIELVLQLLRRQAGNPAGGPPSGPIPVRLSAASWLPGQPLEEWIAQRLMLDYAIPEAAAHKLVAAREVLPILDGLDEMDPDPLGDSGPVRALALLRELNSYGDLGRPAPLVLTCRVERYEQIQGAGPTLQAGEVISIADLDTTCLTDYLHARYSADPRMRALWDMVLQRLDEPSEAAARRVLATPWQLLLAITAAEDGQDPRQLLATSPGEDPTEAEQRLLRVLLASYIPAATRLSHRRSRRGARYRPEQAERWMQQLACHLDWQASYAASHPDPPVGMTAIDIVPHLLWPIGGLRLVRCIHAALLAGAAAALLIGTLIFFRQGHHSHGSISETIAAIIFSLVFGYGARSATERWPEPQLRARTRLDWSDIGALLTVVLVLGLAAGTVLGLVFGLVFGLAHGLEAAAAGPAFGLVLGLMLGLADTTGLAGDSWIPNAMIATPITAFRRQLGIGLVAGLALGLVVGLVMGLVSGPVSGLVSGLAVLVGGLLLNTSWLRYMVGQACAIARLRLPPRLGRFLSWAQESGLLRISGATYQFRHRELQDWLSARPALDTPLRRPHTQTPLSHP